MEKSSERTIVLFPPFSKGKKYFIQGLLNANIFLQSKFPKLKSLILFSINNEDHLDEIKRANIIPLSFSDVKVLLEDEEVENFFSFFLDINLLNIVYARCQSIPTVIFLSWGGIEKDFLWKAQNNSFSLKELELFKTISLMSNIKFICEDNELSHLFSNYLFITEHSDFLNFSEISAIMGSGRPDNLQNLEKHKNFLPLFDESVSNKASYFFEYLVEKMRKENPHLQFDSLRKFDLLDMGSIRPSSVLLFLTNKANAPYLSFICRKLRLKFVLITEELFGFQNFKPDIPFALKMFFLNNSPLFKEETEKRTSKLLSIIVPSYNVEKYLESTIRSLTNSGGEGLEIIIVNDGSKDSTSAIAHSLAQEFPNVIKVIDKPNGGHGSAINSGVTAATGFYLKIVDGDDWLDSNNLKVFLEKLQNCARLGVDMVLTDAQRDFRQKNQLVPLFSYPFLYSEHLYHMAQLCAPERGFTVEACPRLHSTTFRTALLKNPFIKISEKCFFVDMELMVKALLRTETVAYFDLDLFRYRSGYETQSVSPKMWAKNWRDHWKVLNKLIRIAAEEKRLPDKDGKISLIETTMLSPMVQTQFKMCLTVGCKSELNELRALLLENSPSLLEKVKSQFSMKEDYWNWQFNNFLYNRTIFFFTRKISEKVYHLGKNFLQNPIKKTCKYVLPYSVVRIIQKYR